MMGGARSESRVVLVELRQIEEMRERERLDEIREDHSKASTACLERRGFPASLC